MMKSIGWTILVVTLLFLAYAISNDDCKRKAVVVNLSGECYK